MFRAGKRFGAADCAIAVPGSRRGVLRCALHTSLSFWQCWQSHPSATPNRTMDLLAHLLVDLLAAWWAQMALARRSNHALRLGRQMGHPLERARSPAPRAPSRPARSVGVGLSWTGCRKMDASHRERTE